MALNIYAGTSLSGMTALPSPSELILSNEMIWSENTGRAQSGSNQAMMVGDVVAEKKTYAIKWGIITDAEMTSIKTKLPTGFFYFCVGTSAPNSGNNYNGATKFYRSEIQGDYLPIGNTIYRKNVTVQVIEQ